MATATETTERAWVLNEPDGKSKAFHGWEELTDQPESEAWSAWPLVICERDRQRVVGEWVESVKAGRELDTTCRLSNGKRVRAMAKPIMSFDDRIEYFLGIISPVDADPRPPKAQVDAFIQSLDPVTRAQFQGLPFFHLLAAPQGSILSDMVSALNRTNDHVHTKAVTVGSGTGVALPHVLSANDGGAMVATERFAVILSRNGIDVEILAEYLTKPKADLVCSSIRATGGQAGFEARLVPHPRSLAIRLANSISSSA